MQISTGNHYLAFVLSEECRNLILANFPQRHEVVKGDHVTVVYNIKEKDILPIQRWVDSERVFVLEAFIEADGIDLFRVSVNGRRERPMGGIFHLTYTRTHERQSADANKVFSGEIKHTYVQPVSMRLEGELRLVQK